MENKQQKSNQEKSAGCGVRIHKSHFCPPLTHHNLTATATTPNSSTSTSTTIPTITHNTALSLLTNLPPPPLHEH